MKNKLISIILISLMLLMTIPSFAFANDTDPTKDDIFDESNTTAITTTSTDNTTISTTTESSTLTSTSTTASKSTTKAIVNIASPSNFNYQIKSVSSITLLWQKVDGATGYQIYKSEGNNIIKPYKTVYNNYLSESALKRGVKYKYQVIAFKKINGQSYYSDFSNAISFNAFAKKISKVTTKVTKKTVSIKIKAVTGAEEYEIKYSTKKNMKKAKIIKSKKSNVNIKAKKLKKGKKYFVTVRAYKTISGEKVYTSIKKFSFKTKKWLNRIKFSNKSKRARLDNAYTFNYNNYDSTAYNQYYTQLRELFILLSKKLRLLDYFKKQNWLLWLCLLIDGNIFILMKGLL